jgi:hypothetical protein
MKILPCCRTRRAAQTICAGVAYLPSLHLRADQRPPIGVLLRSAVCERSARISLNGRLARKLRDERHISARYIGLLRMMAVRQLAAGDAAHAAA